MDHECCCPPGKPTDTNQSRCPACGGTGRSVDILTVKSLLHELALRRVSGAEYRFCSGASCRTVYFNPHGQQFTVDDVRVAVWQKEPAGARMICYCFDENEAAMRREIEQQGTSEAAQRVRQHIEAGRCACEVRNPLGTCCLGDVMTAVKRIAAETYATISNHDSEHQ